MKKEKLNDFLKKLTDKELAFFSKFRSKEFIPKSQYQIKSELKLRGLTDFNIINLIHDKSNLIEDNCPRCNSYNFDEIKDTEINLTDFGGYEIQINSRKCRICAYNPQKDKPINFRVRLNRFLGKYAWRKLK